MTALLWATIASVLCLVVVALVASNVEVRARGTALELPAGWVADLALLVGCVLVVVTGYFAGAYVVVRWLLWALNQAGRAGW